MENTVIWQSMYLLKRNANSKNLLIENGDIIKILPGNKPEIIDKAPSGKVYLDGNINVETDS